MEKKFKQLQQENRIRVFTNNQNLELTVDKDLNVKIPFSCGCEETMPFLKLLKYPQDYNAL